VGEVYQHLAQGKMSESQCQALCSRLSAQSLWRLWLIHRARPDAHNKAAFIPLHFAIGKMALQNLHLPKGKCLYNCILLRKMTCKMQVKMREHFANAEPNAQSICKCKPKCHSILQTPEGVGFLLC